MWLKAARLRTFHLLADFRNCVRVHAVNLTRDLAIELAPDIRVNCICPGAVDTEMLQDLGRFLGKGDVTAGYAILTQHRPIKRVAHPSEIANSILYVASDLASFVTGSIQVVDGGVMAKAG